MTKIGTSSCTLFILLLAVHGSIQKSTTASQTYKAAVVEFKPVFYLDDALRTLGGNVKKYVKFIELAASEDVDIVVFPELGLTTIYFETRLNLDPWTTLIPDPSENYAPCTNSSVPVSEHLKKIACAARNNSIYVVINLIEKETCSGKDCRYDGIFYYISNVAFDRKGKIVARYRKSHLLDEYGYLDVLKTPEYSAFDTDFGVTFGNVICFDIMYEEPWLTETRRLNITDIIYASGWFSEMPFLTTIQMQAGWAYVEDVNILSSGYNRIRDSYSGSSIIAGRQGVVAAILPLEDHEELLIADVPKKRKTAFVTPTPQRNHVRHLRLTNEDHEQHAHDGPIQSGDSQVYRWRYDKLDAFQSEIIATNGFNVQKLSHNEISCEFRVNITNLSPPVTYRLLAFDGVRQYGMVTVLGSRVCAIIQCANDTIESCGHIRNSKATFNDLAITATCVDNGRTIMMPSTLGTDVLPLQNWAFDERKHERHINTTISLTTLTQNLVEFGVLGRNFEADIVNTEEIAKIEKPGNTSIEI